MYNGIIKFNGITQLSQARFAASTMAHYIGFPLHANGLNAVEIQAIKNWISGVEFVLEIDPAVTWEIAQTHMEILHINLLELNEHLFNVWKNFHPNSNNWIIKNSSNLIENTTHSSEIIYHKKHICQLPTNLEKVNPSEFDNLYGISFNLPVEEETGMGNFELINNFLETL